ncbi:autotransporter beta-domain protein [Chlamydia ibidis 10-1398/6]|uniref:Autotransporter beta-domain protein n=2 Tax=Chlamydia ibidis TaxID=1405396 RepID=A0ABP2XGU1_9CHLA|nr:autotransporter beta-domain protein [Chlamydia ibidis 10-1398/6]
MCALVPNTLWGNFSDLRVIQNLMEVSVDGAECHRGLWASAVANFLHRSGYDVQSPKGAPSPTETRRKFRHHSVGYIVGVMGETLNEDILNASFCQLFGKDKDYFISKNSATTYAGSLYYQHTSWWNGWNKLIHSIVGTEAPLVFNAQLTYSHTSNDLKTKMTKAFLPEKMVLPSLIKGDWGNDCFGLEFGGAVPVDLNNPWLFDTYTPFAKLQLIYAHQGDFKENTEQGRIFDSSSLTNLALPIGMKFERFAKNHDASFNVVLAYSPDIARGNPDCTTSLVMEPSSAIWTTRATNLARNAFIAQAGNHFSITPRCEIFSQFGFELRGSARTYNIDLGSKIQF